MEVLVFIFLILDINTILHAQTNHDLKKEAKKTMLKATKYMVNDVSTNGGYDRLYLPDFFRRWGEIGAFKTQIWLEDGGTADMGNLFLDAYNVTGNEYYYKAAKKVAKALIWGQLPAGGWNYFIDFAGKRSVKKWYATIGKNAWGFEEYYHYYGNATFDDGVTVSAASFLLRVYMEKLDPEFLPALNKAIKFVLKSQYPLGGWPQRYPLKHSFPHGYAHDYTSFYTFNDNVIQNNIGFLIQCYVLLGKSVLKNIRRGMYFVLLSQYGNPQAGWAQQYNMKLQPAHARTFEPASLNPGYTARNIKLLLNFYKYTGDKRFLDRVPDAIQWLKTTLLPKDETDNGRYNEPVFVQVGTNRAMFTHRSGSNVRNGRYWWDYKDDNPVKHYGEKTSINIQQLEKKYKKVSALSPKEAIKNSPLKSNGFLNGMAPQQYDKTNPYFPNIMNQELISDRHYKVKSKKEVKKIIHSLDSQGRWLVKHVQISPPYTLKDGKPTNTAMLSTSEGAAIVDSTNQQYISTPTYIKNMEILISYIKHSK